MVSKDAQNPTESMTHVNHVQNPPLRLVGIFSLFRRNETAAARHTPFWSYQVVVGAGCAGRKDTPVDSIGIIEEVPGVLPALRHAVWIPAPQALADSAFNGFYLLHFRLFPGWHP